MKLVFAATASDLEANLDQRFGRCSYFVLYDTKTKEVNSVTNCQNLNAPPWLGELKVDLVIAGGMGMHARQRFAQAEVEVLTGALADEPRKVVEAFLANVLETGDNVCDH